MSTVFTTGVISSRNSFNTGRVDLFSPSHLSASTLRSVPARIMTCQCLRSSVISVVIWVLAISFFTRSRHLSFGLPRFHFPSIVICNIFLVASFYLSFVHVRTILWCQPAVKPPGKHIMIDNARIVYLSGTACVCCR